MLEMKERYKENVDFKLKTVSFVKKLDVKLDTFENVLSIFLVSFSEYIIK